MFVDEVDILVEAGHGGAGAMSFRREKFVPRGGPDGGDGGKGGSVYAVASPHVNTLVAFRFNREFRAKRGGHGEGSTARAKTRPIELEVPIGTLIYQKSEDPAGRTGPDRRSHRGRPACAARARRNRRAGQRALRQLDQSRAAALRRGAARRNEAASAASETARRRRARRLSECRQIDLDLPHFRRAAENRRLPLHDARAESRRRVAQRQPQLCGGRRARPDRRRARWQGSWRSFFETSGSHEGARHLVDVSGASGRDPVHDFETIQRELAAFSPELAAKPQIVAATKMDAISDAAAVDALGAHVSAHGLPFLRISAVTGDGLRSCRKRAGDT